MTKTKSKFYVWWTKAGAGMTSDYDECLKKYRGQDGGQCKSFKTKEEAEKALSETADVSLDQDGTDKVQQQASTTENQPQIEINSNDEPPEDHDPKYEEFIIFRNKQKELNEKYDRFAASVSTDLNEQAIESKDIECKLKTKIQELKCEFYEAVESLQTLYEQKIDKITKDLESTNKKLTRELKTLKRELEENRRRPNTTESTPIQTESESFFTVDATDGEITNGETDSSADGVTLNIETSNPFETLNGDTDLRRATVHTTESRETIGAEMSRPTGSQSTGEINSEREKSRSETPKLQEPILILSDSILRGVVQSKFSPKQYVNKQYIQGGTDEIINHLEQMNDTTAYSQVLYIPGLMMCARKQ